MVVSTFRGGFADVDGTLDLSGDAAQAQLAPFRSQSIQVKDENLYGHLQSPEFFDSERHPAIRFDSTRVKRDGDDLTLEGDLTIKGVTRRVVAKGTWNEVEADITGAPRIGIDLETTIDRTAHGLSWNAPLPKGGFALANDVALTVHLEFVPGGGVRPCGSSASPAACAPARTTQASSGKRPGCCRRMPSSCCSTPTCCATSRPTTRTSRETDGEPASVTALRETIAQADGVLFATPEYNSSIPGFLKNALDWVSRPIAESPFKGKDVAVVGASTGMFGAVWAQAELRKVLAALGARVVDRELPVMHADGVWAADGSLSDGDLAEQLVDHVQALVERRRRERRLRVAARGLAPGLTDRGSIAGTARRVLLTLARRLARVGADRDPGVERGAQDAVLLGVVGGRVALAGEARSGRPT